jgi:hypothetical protein
VQVGLNERGGTGGSRRRGIDIVRTNVAQDGGVDAVVEACSTAVGDGADPVVVDGLVGIEDERITLCGN